MRRDTMYYLFLLCVFLSGQVLFAQTPAELYAKAAAAYKNNNYSEAQLLYEKLAANHKLPEVYYNLANCYFKNDQLGKAILNYERALRLAPNDEDILHNLQLAEIKTVDKIQPVPQLAIITWWKNFTNALSAHTWSALATVLVWIALVFCAIYLLIIRSKWLVITAVACVIISGLLLFIGYVQHRNIHRSSYGVLTAESANAMSAPDAGSSAILNLHEGTKFLILDQVSEWHKIRLADGRVGWMRADVFERI